MESGKLGREFQFDPYANHKVAKAPLFSELISIDSDGSLATIRTKKTTDQTGLISFPKKSVSD